MEEFRIPQQKISVEIRFQDGNEVSGCMFVPELGLDAHPEPLVDRLNEAERFEPFVHDDMFEMINKSRILCVRLRGAAPKHREGDGTIESQVSIEMQHGLVVEGSVRYLMPHERSRLLDFFNVSPRFIEVAEGNLLTLVNTDFVLRVQALSAEPA